MCETGHSLPSPACRPPHRSTVSAESAAISGSCHVHTETAADARPSQLKFLVIASRHYPPLTSIVQRFRGAVTDCAGARFRVWCLLGWRRRSRGAARGARVRTGSDRAGLCLLSCRWG